MQLLIDLVGLQQDPVGILILVQGGTSSGTGTSTADLDCQTRACGAASTCTEVQLHAYSLFIRVASRSSQSQWIIGS